MESTPTSIENIPEHLRYGFTDYVDLVTQAYILAALEFALEQKSAIEHFGTKGTELIRRFIKTNSPQV